MATAKKRMEFKNCGREISESKVKEQGVCAAIRLWMLAKSRDGQLS